MRPFSEIWPLVLAPAAAIVSAASTIGCSRSAADQGTLAVPQADMVRLIPGSTNSIAPDHLHWTWSVLGERNWTKATASDLKLVLSDSYPFNDVQRMHGSNTWNCDLIALREATDPKVAHWSLTVHGSNGMTAKSTGNAPLNGDNLDAVFIPTLTNELTTHLPASITFARVGQTDVTVDLSK